MTASSRPRHSLRGRLLKAIIRRGRNTAPIAATVAAMAEQEVDGRPDPTPDRFALRGLSVERMLIADTVVFRLRARRAKPRRAMLLLHGGGYIEDASVGTWLLSAQFVRDTDAEVWVPAYRLAPRQTAETTVEAAAAIYRSLLEQWPAESVAVAGDSAGGGLALALTQTAISAGDPPPALLGLFAPWVDLTMSDPEEAAFNDPLLDYGRLVESAKAYAGPLALNDPRVSPIHGHMEGLPPVWIIVGDDDLLVYQNRRLRDRLKATGAPLTYIEDPNMMHVHVIMPLPEARRSLSRFKERLRRINTESLHR